MPVQLLTSRVVFPDPRGADAGGLVAIGGDLGAERLVAAYRSGIFPWTVDPITWWSPNPRGVFELNQFHISKSFARALRKNDFRVTYDRAFANVIRACAEPAAGRRTTWITPEFMEAYCELHRLGHAHSVECWRGKKLVGGVYGVAAGGLFAGESMFHRASDASKVALYHLHERLKERAFSLFDIQMLTPITSQLGAVEIPRGEYLDRLTEAVVMERTF